VSDGPPASFSTIYWEVTLIIHRTRSASHRADGFSAKTTGQEMLGISQPRVSQRPQAQE
jgi:hypothetical protein